MSGALPYGTGPAPLRAAPAAQSQAEPLVPSADIYRAWEITWDYGQFTATGPDYDASWEGEEDGWVDNGQRVSARTREDLITEVDAWLEEHAA